MAGGYPHRVRFRAFNSRYRCLAPFKMLKRTEENVIEDCKTILECFVEAVREQHVVNKSAASTAWAQGKRHIFLSEAARQQLEMLRNAKRNSTAQLIQSVWRGWHFRLTQWSAMRRALLAQKHTAVNLQTQARGVGVGLTLASHSGPGSLIGGRPRPQPITDIPPPEVCDPKVIQEICSLFGLDLVSAALN